jgi:hypothetical protein
MLRSIALMTRASNDTVWVSLASSAATVKSIIKFTFFAIFVDIVQKREYLIAHQLGNGTLPECHRPQELEQAFLCVKPSIGVQLFAHWRKRLKDVIDTEIEVFVGTIEVPIIKCMIERWYNWKLAPSLSFCASSSVSR